MSTGSINNPTPANPLPPARRTGPLAQAPAAPAHPEAPKSARDAASTGPLNVTAKQAHVDLEHVDLPPKKEESMLGSLWGSVTSAAHSVHEMGAAAVHGVEHATDVVEHAVVTATVATGHAIEHAAVATEHAAVKVAHVANDIVQAGVQGVKDGRAHGEGVMSSLGDGVHAAGKKAVEEVVDPVMTDAVGKADKANDKGAGALGPILTNRLQVGASVDIKIEAGATLPTELVGAPNIKLDGGGMLKIKRVNAEDENGKPIMGPDGKQETRLEVELQATGRASAAYSASVGFDATVGVAGHEVGGKATAGAEAEAGLTGTLDLKLRFNPDSEKDMGDLLAMTKATAATGAAAALPGVGTAFALMSKSDYKRSFDSLPGHLESMSGEGGLFAQASASAKLGVGIFKGKDAPPTEGEPPADPATPGLKDKLVDHAHGKLLNQLNGDVANLGLSVGVSGTVGTSYNFRTHETTYSMNVSGEVAATTAALGKGGTNTAADNRRVNLIMGPDGKLKDVTVVQSATKKQFSGVMDTVADVYGRPISPGVIAGIAQSDTISATYHVKPAVLAKMQAGSTADMLGTAASLEMGHNNFRLQAGDVTVDHRNEFVLKESMKVSAGAVAGVRGSLTLGHDVVRSIN